MRINIGGISLLLSEKNAKVTDPCYQKFLSSRHSNHCLRFRLSSTNYPERHYSHRFDSPGLWSIMFNNNRDFCIELRGQKGMPVACIEVLLDRGKGTIYQCTGKDSLGLPPLPFRYPVDEVIFMNILSLYNGLLLHSCGIDDNGRGYIFSGFSGSGKSTLAKQWSGESGVRLLNDDRVIVREIKGSFYAFGTPWHGEIALCDPGKVRLVAIFFIKHGRDNSVKPLSLSEAVSGIIARSFSPLWDKDGMARTLEVAERLARKIPCYELSFYPDRGVIDYIRGIEI